MWAGNDQNIMFPEPTLYNDVPAPDIRISMPEPQHFQYTSPGVGRTGYPIVPFRPQPSSSPWHSANMIRHSSSVWVQTPMQQPLTQFPPNGYHNGPPEGGNPQWQPPTPNIPPPPVSAPQPPLAPNLYYTPPSISRSPSIRSRTPINGVHDTGYYEARLETGHYYNNFPKAVDELDTFRMIFELFGDDFANDLAQGEKLGPEVRNKMQELKTASLAAVVSARGLCSEYEALARKVIENLRLLCQPDLRGDVPRNPVLPNSDLDGMWKAIEEQVESTKTSVGTLHQCTYDLKHLSNDVGERFGRLNIRQKITNWFSNHRHVTSKDHLRSSDSGTELDSSNADLLRRELPASLKQVQLGLVDFNSYRVLQHEDLKDKMEKLKQYIPSESVRRELQDWELFLTALLR